jgi:hypothetical protein
MHVYAIQVFSTISLSPQVHDGKFATLIIFGNHYGIRVIAFFQ